MSQRAVMESWRHVAEGSANLCSRTNSRAVGPHGKILSRKEPFQRYKHGTDGLQQFLRPVLAVCLVQWKTYQTKGSPKPIIAIENHYLKYSCECFMIVQNCEVVYFLAYQKGTLPLNSGHPKTTTSISLSCYLCSLVVL